MTENEYCLCRVMIVLSCASVGCGTGKKALCDMFIPSGIRTWVKYVLAVPIEVFVICFHICKNSFFGSWGEDKNYWSML